MSLLSPLLLLIVMAPIAVVNGTVIAVTSSGILKLNEDLKAIESKKLDEKVLISGEDLLLIRGDVINWKGRSYRVQGEVVGFSPPYALVVGNESYLLDLEKGKGYRLIWKYQLRPMFLFQLSGRPVILGEFKAPCGVKDAPTCNGIFMALIEGGKVLIERAYSRGHGFTLSQAHMDQGYLLLGKAYTKEGEKAALVRLSLKGTVSWAIWLDGLPISVTSKGHRVYVALKVKGGYVVSELNGWAIELPEEVRGMAASDRGVYVLTSKHVLLIGEGKVLAEASMNGGPVQVREVEVKSGDLKRGPEEVGKLNLRLEPFELRPGSSDYTLPLLLAAMVVGGVIFWVRMRRSEVSG